jgi:EAL domain-containing protein (putative c-di-GMP-specific phosphodiesterase class I)
MLIADHNDPDKASRISGLNSFSDLTVLVVEDESHLRNLTASILTDMGVADVVQASDGEEALREIDAKFKGAIDVVVLDLAMPGMDGVEFLRHLSERENKIAVIVSSGGGRRITEACTQLAELYGLYIAGVIGKPVNPSALKELLSSMDLYRTESTIAVSQSTLTKQELVEGLSSDAIEVVYQPKVSVRERRVVGVEALARWKNYSTGTLGGPTTFVSLAEETGHIHELTDIVFKKAVSHLGSWEAQGIHLGLAVNFSPESLTSFDIPDRLVSYAETQGVNPENLTLEVTESRMFSNIKVPLEILTRLSLRGVRLSIDDFGTGHSSLQQIKRIPFTELKIDREFVSNSAQDETKRAIIQSSVMLGRSLGACLVAEGVETQADWDTVEELGCDVVQGYFVSKPILFGEVPDFIKRWEGLG